MEETLLYQLSDEFYLHALGRFEYRTLVASPFYDMLVPYSSASCNLWHPYDEGELEAVVQKLKAFKLTLRNAPMDQPESFGPCIFTGSPGVEEILIGRAY